MENQELNNRIKEFLKSKHFENSFIQECITEFIEGHTKLYGDIISADELFRRLEDNLDQIAFADRKNVPNGRLGEYKGRVADNTDLNEICIYFDESDLELSEMDKKMWSLYTEADKKKLLQDVATKKSQIKSTIIHELTHSAYTIKGKYGMGEKHIFSEIGKDYFLSGEYKQIGGHNNYVEAMVNYISSRIEGKNPDELETYQAETQAIYMLAEKIDEKSIIQSAWTSDEQQFKQAYISAIAQDKEVGEKSYNAFQEGMKRLILVREQNISIGENISKNKQTLSEMQQILDGKTLELESSRFKNIGHTSIEPIEPIKSIFKQEEPTLSFSQKIARFLSEHSSLMNVPFIKKIARFLSKHSSLMNVPFIKEIAGEPLNILPPAKNQPNSNNRRDAFVAKLSCNGTLKLPNIMPTHENPPPFNRDNREGRGK